MKLLLSLCLISIHYACVAQEYLKKSENVYNVYRREVEIIQQYNIEFIKQIPGLKDIKIDSSLVSGNLYFSWDKKGFDNGLITVPITLEAKNGRSRMSFINPTYTNEGKLYPHSGTLASLFQDNRINIAVFNLKTHYRELVVKINKQYHEFLIGKNKDGNW